MKHRTSYYMADFAASDRRSVKAHLAGTSLRAMAYATYSLLAGCVGRAGSAPEDYRAISRFVFKRRDKMLVVCRSVGRIGTAVLGLVAGGFLCYLLEK